MRLPPCGHYGKQSVACLAIYLVTWGRPGRVIASFPGPHPASRRLQYSKVGEGLVHFALGSHFTTLLDSRSRLDMDFSLSQEGYKGSHLTTLPKSLSRSKLLWFLDQQAKQVAKVLQQAS